MWSLASKRHRVLFAGQFLAHVALKSSPKGFSHLRWRRTVKCSTQPSMSTHPTSPPFLSAPLYPTPVSAPSALTTALLTPLLRDNGSLSKKSRKKRTAGCHRIACLLTESLKAAPHKSKKSIIGIVFLRATCSTKIPLLCSLFCLFSPLLQRVGKDRG